MDKVEPKIKKEIYKVDEIDYLMISALKDLTNQIRRLAEK